MQLLTAPFACDGKEKMNHILRLVSHFGDKERFQFSGFGFVLEVQILDNSKPSDFFYL